MIKEGTIVLDGVETEMQKFGTKYTILSNKGEKYFFYDTVKGGAKSKAFAQWEQFGFKRGDAIEIAFEESQEKFTNDKGKEVQYTKRKIAYFPTTPENAPKGLPPTQSGTGQQVITLEGLQRQISDIKERLEAVEKRLDTPEVPF